MQAFQSPKSANPAPLNQQDDQKPEAEDNLAIDKKRASQPGNFTRDRSISETQQVCDSTSDDTNSQHEEVQGAVDDVDEDKLVGKYSENF